MTQFKEARRVEATLRPLGKSAELLFGKMELHLDDQGAERRSA